MMFHGRMRRSGPGRPAVNVAPAIFQLKGRVSGLCACRQADILQTKKLYVCLIEWAAQGHTSSSWRREPEIPLELIPPPTHTIKG